MPTMCIYYEYLYVYLLYIYVLISILGKPLIIRIPVCDAAVSKYTIELYLLVCAPFHIHLRHGNKEIFKFLDSARHRITDNTCMHFVGDDLHFELYFLLLLQWHDSIEQSSMYFP